MLTAPNRAPLQAWALDIIANGIQEADDNDRRPLFRACLRVACSAINHGWGETEFRNLLQDGVKTEGGRPSNRLWQQLNTRRGRTLNWHTVDQFLSKVWRYAEANLAKGPDPDRESNILTVAQRWSEVIASRPIGLSRAERLVLHYVIEEVLCRKFRNVTCPGRQIAQCSGLSHQGAVNALTKLRERGILTRRSHGTPGYGGKAAIYSLNDPDNRESLLGEPTLPHEKPYEKPLFITDATVGVHINSLLGEGKYTSITRQVNREDHSPSGKNSQENSADKTIGWIQWS